MLDSNPVQYIIPDHYYGLRLDQALAQLFPHYSRTQLSGWFKTGRITIQPPYRKLNDKVRGGEQVTCMPLDCLTTSQVTALEPEAIDLCIVFEDEHCLVLNKPAGLITHPGAGNPKHTLVNALLYHDARLHHLPRAGLIHRLDKDTTGLLIVAKTEAAYAGLVKQMQARYIEREYQALVYGHVISGGIIDTAYGRSPRQRLKMAVLSHGKRAITHYSIKQHYPGCTLLTVKLMTGRTHQIRVHLAHLKHPLIGDPLYGGRARHPQGLNPTQRHMLSSFKRQALHAYSLSFIHPISQHRLTLTTPLPDDFQLLLQALSNET